MTETAGLIKPLEWTFIEGNPGHFSAITECGDHYAALKHKAWRNGGALTSDSPSGYDEAKAVCEAAYRDSILPQLNLEAYRAQIRAETLEELAVYCDKHQVGVNPRSGYRIDEFCAPEGTHPGMAYAAEFRKMKGSPS